MVSPSKPNQAKLREKATEPRDNLPRKTIKPLAYYKFYLDIKNRILSSKVEAKIKQLGGNVEVFLVREVTVVVSDQLGFQLNVPATPPTPSPGPSPCPSNESGSLASPVAHIKAARPRPKSRADAMLERVRQQPQAQQTSNGPLDIARSWSIPIWTVERALKFLEKLSAEAKAKLTQIERQKKNKTKTLIDNFVKIENCARDCRPQYKELNKWPCINASGYFGITPFSASNTIDLVLPKNCVKYKALPEKNKKSDQKVDIVESNLKNRMTRRSRLRHRTREVAKSPQSGFCEICQVDYGDLAKHARSETHLNFVRNDGNFLTLDTLISAGANVEAFLKLNGTVKELSSNNYGFGRRSLRSVVKSHETSSIKDDDKIMSANLELLNTPTNDDHHRVTRKSHSDRILNLSKLSQSEKNSENNHRLRSRGQICIPSNLLGTTAEDECKSVKSPPNNRSPKDKRSSRSNGRILDDDVTEEFVKPKRVKGIRWRCPSPDAPPVVPASPCYKVVGTRGKSRTDNKKCDNDPRLVVKFQRVRQSELSTLSDEAESFMFPKKEDNDNPDDDNPSSEKDSFHSSSELRTSTPAKIEYTSELTDTLNVHDVPTEPPANRSRKRRTQAEAFIGDNTDYYKFEPTDSRLRFQTAPIQTQTIDELTSLKDEELSSDKEELDDESDQAVDENGESVEDWVGASTLEQTGYAPSAQIETLTFSFEYVPRNEPWYNTYKRQDEGKEFKSVPSDESPSCSYSRPVVLPYQIGILPPLRPNCCPLNKVDPKQEIETESTSTTEIKKKRQKKELLLGKNSRKSPREHASTLATLASLVQQRKKRESKDSGKATAHDLSSIPEEDASSSYSTPVRQTGSESVENVPSEIESIEKRVDEMLANVYDDMEEIEIDMDGPDPAIRLDKPDIEDIVELIETYSECSVLDMDVLQRHFKNLPSAVGKQDGRLRKKRKKNRTGWPNKKKVLIKKDNNKSDVSVSASEIQLDNSVVTSDYGTGLTKICESINDIEITMQVSEKASVELSSDSCIASTVTHEQIDSCSNTTDSGKENQCTNEKTVVFDSADIYTLSSRFESNNKTDILKVFANGSANTSELVTDKNKSADGRDISETVLNSDEENLHLKANVEVWESAERTLSKLNRNQLEEDELSDDRRSSREFQPFVCVKKIDESGSNRRLRSSSSSRSSLQPRAKKQRQGSPRNIITPSCSPRPIVSPRRLRVPRGRWYRER